jgi:hypothetical protein
LLQPTLNGQVCSVVSGDSGIVNGAAPPNVAIACSSTAQPTIGDFGTAPITSGGQGGQFYFSSGNASTCVLNSLVLWQADGFVEIYGSNGIGSSLVGIPLPTAYPGYGTDTETLTCYQIGEGGDTAAFSGPQIISNPGLPAPTLAITSFSYDSVTDDASFGALSWTTSGSTSNTTCAILDEFSGDGVTTPLAQNPNPITGATTGLPANSAPTYPSGLPYPYDFCAGVFRGLSPDNMTLTCSDPTAGTAAKSIPVDVSAVCSE